MISAVLNARAGLLFCGWVAVFISTISSPKSCTMFSISSGGCGSFSKRAMLCSTEQDCITLGNKFKLTLDDIKDTVSKNEQVIVLKKSNSKKIDFKKFIEDAGLSDSSPEKENSI